MVGKLVSLALAVFLASACSLFTTPASAQAPQRTWVQAGTLLIFKQCIDTNSIHKRSDGLTSYEDALTNSDSECTAGNEDLASTKTWSQNLVNCAEDMSGGTIAIKSRGIPEKGELNAPWTATSPDSGSLTGQGAKFVCRK